MELSENEKALEQLRQASYGLNPYDPAVEGHKYGMPEITAHMNHKDRYGPVILQVTKLLMRHGKLAKAQRVCLLPWPVPAGHAAFDARRANPSDNRTWPSY